MPDYLIHKSKTGIANTAEWQETDMHQLQNQAAGDILYAADGTKLTRLAKGTDGQALLLASGLPAWTSIFDSTHPADLAAAAAEGSATVAARRDHVHLDPVVAHKDLVTGVHGLDPSFADTTLSGTPKILQITDEHGTPYYVKVYPTKA